jgi:mannose-6-phosphate isomerase-like protein (cupin superfamily)
MSDSAEHPSGTIVSTSGLVSQNHDPYFNSIISRVNDQIVRLSVMTGPYFWHSHPDSDETFFVVEGQLAVEFVDRELVLDVGELVTIGRGVVHRTRPIGLRSVNLTVESNSTTTVREQVCRKNESGDTKGLMNETSNSVARTPAGGA